MAIHKLPDIYDPETDRHWVWFTGDGGLVHWNEILKQASMSKGKMPKPTKGGKGKGKC